ncbi:MAG TPA: iron chelate uptake ABC transporter family permease subunit, partial [Cellulomonas sp.]
MNTTPTPTATKQQRPAARGRARVVGTRSNRVSLRVDVRSFLIGVLLLALIVVISAVTLSTGDYHIPLPDVIRTLFGGGSSAQYFIIETLRLPRLLTGLLVGAALGIGGAVFQSLSRNPLGSP